MRPTRNALWGPKGRLVENAFKAPDWKFLAGTGVGLSKQGREVILVLGGHDDWVWPQFGREGSGYLGFG